MPKRKAILVLEDESTLARALSAMLEREGFETIVAGDGNAAVSEIEQVSFDLVLLDLVTPGIDGFEVLRCIRDKSMTTPVFILSNLSEEADKKRAIELGADKYFVKSETLLSEIADQIKTLFNKEQG